MSDEKKRYLVARLFEASDYDGNTQYISERVIESGDVCELTEAEAKLLRGLGHTYSERYFAIEIVRHDHIKDAIRRAAAIAIDEAAVAAERAKKIKENAKRAKAAREAKAVENAERLLKSKGML